MRLSMCLPSTISEPAILSDHACINSAVAIYLVYLFVIGFLGIVCWLGTIWAVKAGKWWARSATIAMF